MPKNAQRILIADSDFQQRLIIEQRLNQIGYFRIAPVSTADELGVLACGAVSPFDLLIVSEEMAHGFDSEILMPGPVHPVFLRVLVYHCTGRLSLGNLQRLVLNPLDTLDIGTDFASIRRLMCSVENSPVPCGQVVGYSQLEWHYARYAGSSNVPVMRSILKLYE